MHSRTWLSVAAAVAITAALPACGDDESTCDENCPSGGSGAGAAGAGGSGGEAGGGGAGGQTTGGGGEGGEGGGPLAEWIVPTCSPITGSDAITYTTDQGETLTPTAGVLHGVGYTGVAALDTPNTLVAAHKGELLLSEDAGCSWTAAGALEGDVFQITAGRGGVAYAWVDNGLPLYRIENGAATMLTPPAQNIIGLGIDPEDSRHLRIGDASGSVSDSTDGGETWTKQGTTAPHGDLLIAYRMAFDPTDLDHYLFGQATDGAEVTFDGGETWEKSTGLGVHANAFSLAVSPADPTIVWAESLEVGPDTKSVYRSTDGGLTFDPVVDESAEVTLVNGALLVAHPSDPDVVYFVFGTNYANYGTDIFRYDAGADELTKTHNDYDDVWAIAFSPADDSVMYFGLVVEEVN